MFETSNVRPLAEHGREQFAKECFPFQHLSPEEYAARHGADIGCFSFDEYSYRDPLLERWLLRLGTILRTPGLLERYQEEMLSDQELRDLRARAEEAF